MVAPSPRLTTESLPCCSSVRPGVAFVVSEPIRASSARSKNRPRRSPSAAPAVSICVMLNVTVPSAFAVMVTCTSGWVPVDAVESLIRKVIESRAMVFLCCLCSPRRRGC